MLTRVTKCNGSTITVEATIDVGGPMHRAEEALAAAVNEVGMVATVEALQQFDPGSELLIIDGQKWIAKQSWQSIASPPIFSPRVT